jgi:translation initiation factor IF-2
MGMFVSINQRLDAEAITFISDEFGYEVQFVSAEEEVQSEISEEVDTAEDLLDRAPIVTIMGHVDHGKTSLLDYIRQANVAGGEAGGITQHIGAYNVKTKTGKQVTFLDTPGHEAFTAMRARGAKVTDVVIIVIAADDSIMPQTREAINHAQVAGVPIVFAFSKVDKPGANTEKIREELANMNLLVEDWGGKYQSQEISSKSGLGIDELLEKVLLEAEMLELKANPNRRAAGTVVEAALDKGRGYVATILVQTGTLKVGDILLAGAHYGRVKAMTDYLGKRLKQAGPSVPVQVLGLNGAPQAGDKINVMENERDARDIANKREQLLREQSMRTRRHITLEEIGRRKAIGTFKELNLIIKGDVDGSVEALSDSLLQLSTNEIQVNIIHKAVGQISESDVNLAIASDAIIVGFQVRPSASAKKMAEQDQIEIRHYSVIYQAIDEIKDAMTGMLAPTVEEFVTGNIEIRETFKISRVGTIAGCYVTDGFVKRNNKIRIIRDGIVLHTGEIDSLKRYKDDVTEVRSGYECGLNIKNFNDIEQGDIIESFELREIKRTL